jgi:hypothetical protein
MYRQDGKIAYSKEVGTLTGHGPKPGHLQLTVAFSERDKAPRLGEFIVIQEVEFLKRRILCRVEEIGYGDFQTTRGERERALVEKYIRKSAGHNRQLTEEEKKSLFFLAYTLRVLGEIRENKGSLKIGTDYRMLPELTATCRVPNEQEFKLIVSSGLESTQNRALPTIGRLSFGEDVVNEISIPFEPGKFDSKRTAVFARTGYGKSNLTKSVVALAAATSKSGILILDLDGEYPFRTKNPDGTEKYGLVDIDILKPKLVIYTERKEVDFEQGLDIRRIINLSKLAPWYIADLMLEQDKKVVQDFRTMKYISGAKEAWDNLVKTLSANYDNDEDDHGDVGNKMDAFFKAIKCSEEQRRPLRREITRLKKLHNPEAGNLVESIRKDTAQGKLVVLDLSLFEVKQAIRIAQTVLTRIFSYNLWAITQNKAKPVIAVFEEAQNVLNKKAVEEGESIFVRWAKEGRKFQLGLIYVTQQPGAIAEEIVSQTDNFFVMHLLNKGDIDALTRANRHYDGVIAQFLGDETVVGNAYVYSAPKQPYVFPCQLFEFTPTIFDESYGKFRLGELAQHLKGKFTPNRDDVKKAIGGFSKVVYSYFDSQKDKCKPSWLDPEKQWVDYSYAQSLLRILDQTKLFPVYPELSNHLRTDWQKEKTDAEDTEEE